MTQNLQQLPPYFAYAKPDDEFGVDIWFSNKKLLETHLNGSDDTIYKTFVKTNERFKVQAVEDMLFVNKRDFSCQYGDLDCCPYDLVEWQSGGGKISYRLGKGRNFYKMTTFADAYTDTLFNALPEPKWKENLLSDDVYPTLEEFKGERYGLQEVVYWDCYNSENQCRQHWQEILDNAIENGSIY